MNIFKKIIKAFKPKPKLRTDIKLEGAPWFNPITGEYSKGEMNSAARDAILQPRGEVIVPTPEDTPYTLCEKMSQAATDHEFERIIVYPIQGEFRWQVLEILKTDAPGIGIEGKETPVKYPMYEYMPANIMNDTDLDSKTIIFKYSNIHQGNRPI